MQLNSIEPRDFLGRRFENIIFAGGGNRCWWQAGLVEQLSTHSCWQVKQFVGVSAGAGIATALAANRIAESLDACVQRFRRNLRNMEWGQLLRGKRPFVLPGMYREWTKSFLTESSFEAIKKSGIALNIAITRPIKGLPLPLSALIALGLYSSKKFLFKKYHSAVPHALGFRSEHVDLARCGTLDEAHQLLAASAAAVPITPVVTWAGRPALDGGFYDSIPLPKAAFKRSNTLVLLTRYRPKQPHIFEIDGCTYIQPSTAINVVNFDCTNAENVNLAYAHGIADARAILSK
jgi:hypothetical protein